IQISQMRSALPFSTSAPVPVPVPAPVAAEEMPTQTRPIIVLGSAPPVVTPVVTPPPQPPAPPPAPPAVFVLEREAPPPIDDADLVRIRKVQSAIWRGARPARQILAENGLTEIEWRAMKRASARKVGGLGA